MYFSFNAHKVIGLRGFTDPKNYLRITSWTNYVLTFNSIELCWIFMVNYLLLILGPMYHVLPLTGISLALAPSLASPLWLKSVCMAVAVGAKAEDSAC